MEDTNYRDLLYYELKEELRVQKDKMTKAERDYYRSRSNISELEYLIRKVDDAKS